MERVPGSYPEDASSTLAGPTEVKRCSKCKATRDLSEYTVARSRPDGLNRVCKSCDKLRKAAHNAAVRRFTTTIKRKCMDCGGSFPPECMDLDHRDREEKFRAVGEMGRYSFVRVREEVAKCDVVCANCHRIRTHQRGDHLPIPESSNGRTDASEASNLGSNPGSGSTYSLFELLGI